MLDINYIRENPDAVKKACRDKQLKEELVDELLESDKQRRDLLSEVQVIRQKVNQNADEIKKLVHDGAEPSAEQVKNGKKLKAELKSKEPALKKIEADFEELLLAIPNVPAVEVPIGPDESGNQVVRTVGEFPKFDFKAKNHDELMLNLDLLDTKRAVKIAGFRGYFLKNEAVLLEQAILNYALDLMIKKDFTPMTVPVLVKKEAMIGTAYFPWGADDHYYTQDEQILAGTAEVALTAYHQGEVLREKDLPIKMTGISPCFRREVGSYGKDTKGVIRLHQFNKVEQVVYTVADEEETRKWHEKMLGFSEELLQNLALPYQIVMMCTGDMGAGQHKKYDIETWFPGQNKYRETHSCSYFNDFQSRRLGIKYQAKDGSTKFVYTLNNTVAATPRLLAAIVENYQQADGSIKVPEVLKEQVGKEVIG
ncbi:MAG: serine--tRNA ligase [Candidatus Woesebacteria bacterium]|jgi:seryl-tRNA synthetase